MVWAYAWYATIALVSIRFITHLLFDHSYQLGMLGAADTSVQALWNDFAIHLRPLRQYYRAAHLAWRPFWIEGVIALTFFCVASAVASSRRLAGSQPRKTWIGVLIAFAVWQLGLLPFSFMPHNYRTQFFAAPGVAALFACLIGCAVANLRGRIRTLIGVSLAAWMVTVTTVAAWTTQQRSRRENAASFEKVIDVCDQVRSLSPRFVPGTLCVFLVNADAESPLGEGAAMEYISQNEFHGAFGVQATVVDPPAPGQPLPNPGTVSFAPDGVRIRPRTGDKRIELYSYDKLVLYRLGWEGAVSLLEKVPNSLLPHGQEGLAYAPLARMLPGPIPSTRFYQYPAWSLPPEDIVDYRSGVFLADRWGELQYSEGKLSRWAGDDAEILINPAGLTLRTLKFVLNSENESPPGVLEAVNDAGEVVATASDENVGGNNRAIEIALPLAPDVINRFRLRLNAASRRLRHFKIVRAGPPVPPNAKYAGPTRIRRNICDDDSLVLKRGWCETEGARLGTPFRWVENDAVLAPQSEGEAGTLHLEVEPGPGLGGRTGELTVADEAGKILARETLSRHQKLRVPVPASLPGKQELVLHITNGGTPIPTDPRILNFRVFRAELLPDATANAGRELR